MAFASVLASALLTGYLVMRVSDQIAEASSETTRNYGLASLRDLMDGFVQIGFQLDRMTSLQSIIERDKALDPSVISIDIFGRDGQIVFSTDPAAIRLVAPPEWQQLAQSIGKGRAQGQSTFQLRERDEIETGTVVLDAIGQPLATIVVTAAQEQMRRNELGVDHRTGQSGGRTHCRRAGGDRITCNRTIDQSGLESGRRYIGQSRDA